jgi:glutamyl-tRNA reductase
VLHRAAMAAALKARRHRPVFLLDLAVPRDIEPAVGDIADTYLYSIDDLRATIRENLASRQRAAEQAAGIIASRARQLSGELRSADAAPVIRDLREEDERQRERSLARARRMLASGRDPQVVLEYLAHSLTNRILHRPTVGLRRAGEEGDAELVRLARRLFDTDDDKGDAGA